MRVLMITGDRTMLRPSTEAYARLELQRAAVDEIALVLWGAGGLLPRLPTGAWDVVTVQDPFWRGLYAFFVARFKRASFNVQVHTDFDAETRQKPLRRAIARFVLARADSVRVVSERVRSQVQTYTRAPILILPVFVDIEAIRSAAPSSEFAALSKKILVVARLEPEKNIGAAINMMPAVLSEVPDAKLLIAGTGSQEQLLRAHTHKLGLESTVLFLGYRRDLPSIYKAVDVVLVPSLYESYGASIVEALAAGTPVVCGDVGIAREAGAIVTPAAEWKDTLVRCLQQKGKGELQIATPSRAEWARRFQASLEGRAV